SFYLSSRRRHTRFSRDWSSDVCSSDLGADTAAGAVAGTTADTTAGAGSAADAGAGAEAGVISAEDLAPLGILLLVIAGALLAGLGLSWLRLRRLLSDRTPIERGAALGILIGLTSRANLPRRVRLSSSARLDVPIAIGIFRPEICLPERALTELDLFELETMLAHELAHLVRRDPAWRLLAGAVCRGLFIQPLNRLVAARLEASSEMLADDWAVEQTARPLALARCLTEVAGWVARPLGAAVPAMARQGSGLGRRVRRLIAAGDMRRGRSRERWLVPVIAALFALLVFAAPGATDTAPPRAASVRALSPVVSLAAAPRPDVARP